MMDFPLSLSGPGRVNQLGGLYINGKPLPKEIREEIIELARIGIRPCDISRRMKITHGCISKLLSKFQKTGSINPGGANVGRPRVITPRIEQKIEQYRREQPGIFSWELRDRLFQENVCRKENLPSLSSISRLIKQKMIGESRRKEQQQNGGEKDARTVEGHTSPLQQSILDERLKDHVQSMETNEESATNDRSSNTNQEGHTEGEESSLLRPQRRQRAKYTIAQLHELEAEFDRNPYPNAWDREALANKLGIHETRIQVWFSNRRAKGRRRPFSPEPTTIQMNPPLMCTCHKYSAPLLTPWMLDPGASRLYFPAAYWDDVSC